MKYLVLFFFFTISTFSQEINNDSIQINWINHANLCLNFKDNLNAFSSFKNAYLENKTNEFGSLAYKKLDSLNLYKEYLEFFNIQRKTEGRIEK